MQFWQRFWEEFDKKPRLLHLVSENDWKNDFFSEKFSSSNCSSRYVKRSFDDPVENLPRKSQKTFAQALRKPKKFSKKRLL